MVSFLPAWTSVAVDIVWELVGPGGKVNIVPRWMSSPPLAVCCARRQLAATDGPQADELSRAQTSRRGRTRREATFMALCETNDIWS